jgi:hypothetical protein
MANESDKKLYLRLELDTEKFRTVREAIVELTGMVKELARELNGIGGGNRGQLSLFGGMDTNSRDKIPIPRAGDTGSGMAGAGGGINGVASGVAHTASELKSTTSDAIHSLKAMTTEVKSAVDTQSQALSRLKNNFQEVKGQLDLFSKSSLTPFSQGGDNSQNGQLDLFGPRAPRTRPGEQLGLFSGAQLSPGGGLSREQAQAYGYGTEPPTPGWDALKSGAMGWLGRGIMGLGAMGGAVIPYLAQQFVKSDYIRDSESLALGMDPLRRAAAAGSSLGIMGQGMRGAQNLAAVDAFLRLSQTGRVPGGAALNIKDVNDTQLGRTVLGQGIWKDGIGFDGNLQGSPNARDELAREPSSLVLHPWDNTNNVFTSETDYAVRRRLGDKSSQEREDLAQALQYQIQSDPARANVLGFFTQNAPGGLGRMVASHRAPRKTTRWTPLSEPVVSYTDSTVGMRQGTPFSDESGAAFEGQVNAAAGLGLGPAYGRALQLYEAGGLQGATGIFARANQFGNNGMNFINAISAASGSESNGLLNATAASQIGDFISKQSLTGIGIQGTAALQGALGWTAGISGSIGESMMNARQFAQGSDAFNKDISRGGLDPLQQAINHHASFGLGGSMYGRLAIERLSPTEIANIMRGGDMGEMGVRRIPSKDVGQYAENQANFMFARYSRQMGAGGGANPAVEQARQMGIGAYLRANKKNLRGAVDELAVGLEDASGGKYDFQTARGMIGQIGMRDKTLAPILTKGGIGVTTSKTSEQQVIDEQHKANKELADGAAKMAPEIDKMVALSTKLGNTLTTLSGDLDKTGLAFVKQLKAATDALVKFTPVVTYLAKIGKL